MDIGSGGYTEPDADIYGDCYGYSDRYRNGYGLSYIHTDSDCYSYSYSDCYNNTSTQPYTNCNRNTDIYSKT